MSRLTWLSWRRWVWIVLYTSTLLAHWWTSWAFTVCFRSIWNLTTWASWTSTTSGDNLIIGTRSCCSRCWGIVDTWCSITVWERACTTFNTLTLAISDLISIAWRGWDCSSRCGLRTVGSCGIWVWTSWACVASRGCTNLIGRTSIRWCNIRSRGWCNIRCRCWVNIRCITIWARRVCLLTSCACLTLTRLTISNLVLRTSNIYRSWRWNICSIALCTCCIWLLTACTFNTVAWTASDFIIGTWNWSLLDTEPLSRIRNLSYRTVSALVLITEVLVKSTCWYSWCCRLLSTVALGIIWNLTCKTICTQVLRVHILVRATIWSNWSHWSLCHTELFWGVWNLSIATVGTFVLVVDVLIRCTYCSWIDASHVVTSIDTRCSIEIWRLTFSTSLTGIFFNDLILPVTSSTHTCVVIT